MDADSTRSDKIKALGSLRFSLIGMKIDFHPSRIDIAFSFLFFFFFVHDYRGAPTKNRKTDKKKIKQKPYLKHTMAVFIHLRNVLTTQLCH